MAREPERKLVDRTFRCIDEDFLFPGKMEYVGHEIIAGSSPGTPLAAVGLAAGRSVAVGGPVPSAAGPIVGRFGAAGQPAPRGRCLGCSGAACRCPSSPGPSSGRSAVLSGSARPGSAKHRAIPPGLLPELAPPCPCSSRTNPSPRSKPTFVVYPLQAPGVATRATA